jgi:hypothetical protein
MRRRVGTAFAAGWLVVGCAGGGGDTPHGATAPGTPLTAVEDSLLTAWLECIECVAGERDSVVAIGQRIPAAGDVLHRRLQDGPSPDQLNRMTAWLTAGFARNTAWARANGRSLADAGLIMPDRHLALALGRYDRTVRHRAAVALLCIGTPEMLAALRDTTFVGRLPPAAAEVVQPLADSAGSEGFRTRRCR